MLLTSSRRDRVNELTFPGLVVMSLQDVLKRPDSLVIDREMLSGRLGSPLEPETAGPIALSPDGKTLRINHDPPIVFRSDVQIAAIRRLVDAYHCGTGLRAADLTDLGSLNRLFGTRKWKALSPYLKSDDGLWSFEP